jgi:hypothetical protein
MWPETVARAFRRVGVVACLLAGTTALCGQNTLNYLQTGSGQPLASLSQTLPVNGLASPELVFNFGFVTQEVVQPGTLLSSFTVTVENPATAASAVLVTIDAGGPVWAPVSPGNLTLSDSQILRQGILPPTTPPVQGQGSAYSVVFPLPASLVGSTLQVSFDLFDDQSGKSSIGWYSGLALASTPEPGTWALLLLGAGLLVLGRRRGR